MVGVGQPGLVGEVAERDSEEAAHAEAAVAKWGVRSLAADRTSDGRPIRMLRIADEFTRECLPIGVAKKFTSEDVVERRSDLFVQTGVS